MADACRNHPLGRCILQKHWTSAISLLRSPGVTPQHTECRDAGHCCCPNSRRPGWESKRTVASQEGCISRPRIITNNSNTIPHAVELRAGPATIISNRTGTHSTSGWGMLCKEQDALPTVYTPPWKLKFHSVGTYHLIVLAPRYRLGLGECLLTKQGKIK